MKIFVYTVYAVPSKNTFLLLNDTCMKINLESGSISIPYHGITPIQSVFSLIPCSPFWTHISRALNEFCKQIYGEIIYFLPPKTQYILSVQGYSFSTLIYQEEWSQNQKLRESVRLSLNPDHIKSVESIKKYWLHGWKIKVKSPQHWALTRHATVWYKSVFKIYLKLQSER